MYTLLADQVSLLDLKSSVFQTFEVQFEVQGCVLLAKLDSLPGLSKYHGIN